ncbi:MAG: hypothetical protein H3C68_00275 [Deltaproteobacteria bacterium]|nr:hypothetical protein [Deltaproteobacteria bacterium]MBZ0219316.1 hypothetical protein [Deltaproteobacteria bacterium]
MGKWTISAVLAALLASAAVEAEISRIGAAEPRYSFSVKTAMDTVSRWPDASREAAMEMIGKYGAPDGITGEVVYWRNRGEWLEIIIRKNGAPHNFPVPHEDVLEQVVAYEVPPGRHNDLAVFNGSVVAERTRGTLSARCRSEAMNYVALNLAHEIITESITIEAARESFAAIIRDHMEGKMHRYARGLQFRLERPDETGDTDFAF